MDCREKKIQDELLSVNQQFDSTLWSAESNTLNLQLSQVTVTTGKQCRRVDSVIFEETLSLRTWIHCVCLSSESVTVFFLSDWRWVVMRRKRRTEQSLQGSAVCLWRVTGPCIILTTSVMNLDPHTQSKKPATNLQTESSENEPVNDVFWIKTCLCLQRSGPQTESRVSRVQLCVSEEWLVQRTSSSKLQ